MRNVVPTTLPPIKVDASYRGDRNGYSKFVDSFIDETWDADRNLHACMSSSGNMVPVTPVTSVNDKVNEKGIIAFAVKELIPRAVVMYPTRRLIAAVCRHQGKLRYYIDDNTDYGRVKDFFLSPQMQGLSSEQVDVEEAFNVGTIQYLGFMTHKVDPANPQRMCAIGLCPERVSRLTRRVIANYCKKTMIDYAGKILCLKPIQNGCYVYNLSHIVKGPFKYCFVLVTNFNYVKECRTSSLPCLSVTIRLNSMLKLSTMHNWLVTDVEYEERLDGLYRLSVVPDLHGDNKKLLTFTRATIDYSLSVSYVTPPNVEYMCRDFWFSLERLEDYHGRTLLMISPCSQKVYKLDLKNWGFSCKLYPLRTYKSYCHRVEYGKEYWVSEGKDVECVKRASFTDYVRTKDERLIYGLDREDDEVIRSSSEYPERQDRAFRKLGNRELMKYYDYRSVITDECYVGLRNDTILPSMVMELIQGITSRNDYDPEIEAYGELT